MKKLLGILVLGLLLITNITEAKTKDIGNGLTIDIPKKYKYFKINFKKLMSTFPAIKKMLNEDQSAKDDLENFGISLKAKLVVIADNQRPIAKLKQLFSKDGLEKIMKQDIEPLSEKYIAKYCETNDCEKLSKLPQEEQDEIVAKILGPAWIDLIRNKWKINQYAMLLIGESLSDDIIEEIETEYEDYQEESEEEKMEIIKELIEKHNFSEFELLFLDTEGYDGKIINDFFLNLTIRPIIILEYVHINNEIFKKLVTNLEKNK